MMKTRYTVILVENGRYAIYDEYRKIRLSEVYDTLDKATHIGTLFERLNIVKERCNNE